MIWLHLGTFNAIGDLARNVEELKSSSSVVEELKGIAESLKAESRAPLSDGMTANHNLELAALSDFRATLAATPNPRPREVFEMARLRISPEYYIPGTDSSMALLYDLHRPGDHRVVFIEWTTPRPGREQEVRENLWRVSGVLSFQKPDSMLLPFSYGVVNNAARGLGMVLMPPHHIRMDLPPLDKIPSGEISQKRKPSTLDMLISGTGSPMPNSLSGPWVDLGMRFRIALKLARAIHIMHTADLLHKLR